MGLTGGGESCSLFVPDMNPFDLTLAAQRVSQPIKTVADNAINPFDAGRDENFRELIRDRLCHSSFPFVVSTTPGRLYRMFKCSPIPTRPPFRRECAAAARHRQSVI